MVGYILKRVGVALLSVICLSFIVFLLVNIEPNLRKLAIGQVNIRASEASLEGWLERNGYREPVVERYAAWLGLAPKRPITNQDGRPTALARNCAVLTEPTYSGLLQGDLGCSVRFKGPVADRLLQALGSTGVLLFWVMVVMTPTALIIGVLAGMREGSRVDRTLSVASILTTSAPEYVSGVILTIIFASWLGVLNGSATTAITSGPTVENLALPVLTLSLYGIGLIARITRASLAEVMTAQYIRTARLKGLPFFVVVLRHALRNALIAPFTMIVLMLPWLLSGVVVVETMFNYKGFGWVLVAAASSNDINMMLACAVISTALVMFTQVILDIGYVIINPRVRVW